MQEIGTIISLQANKALIQVNRGDKCEGCNVCHAFGENKMQLEASNHINAQVGDVVQVDINPGDVLRGSILVFLFPLAMMIVGYFVGMRFSVTGTEGAGILGALVALALSFVVVKFVDRSKQDKSEDTAIITEIVQKC